MVAEKMVVEKMVAEKMVVEKIVVEKMVVGVMLEDRRVGVENLGFVKKLKKIAANLSLLLGMNLNLILAENFK